MLAANDLDSDWVQGRVNYLPTIPTHLGRYSAKLYRGLTPTFCRFFLKSAELSNLHQLPIIMVHEPTTRGCKVQGSVLARPTNKGREQE